jgi:hypothetical protein
VGILCFRRVKCKRKSEPDEEVIIQGDAATWSGAAVTTALCYCLDCETTGPRKASVRILALTTPGIICYVTPCNITVL